MARPSVFLSRLVALTIVWLLATAAFTYAASRRITTAVKPPRLPVAPAQRKVIVVPDVRRQPYVFAKGILGDAGLAWNVSGPVQGFPANIVAAQSPSPGTRVVDTGAPTISLRLEAAPRQLGVPESSSPFRGTPIQLADAAVNPVRVPRTVLAAPEAAPKPRPKPRPVATKPKPRLPQSRPPAFAAPGAPREPLDELPLPVRAQRLLDWVETGPAATDANVSHWLYQHGWIVTGARFGWWRGDEALRTLLQVDARVWKLWGIGARSADVARRALAEVEARSQ